MDSRQLSALSKAASRERMRRAGFYETTVFIHMNTRDAMDAAIARGRFKTRREAMEHAITSMFRTENGENKGAAPPP